MPFGHPLNDSLLLCKISSRFMTDKHCDLENGVSGDFNFAQLGGGPGTVVKAACLESRRSRVRPRL